MNSFLSRIPLSFSQKGKLSYWMVITVFFLLPISGWSQGQVAITGSYDAYTFLSPNPSPTWYNPGFLALGLSSNGTLTVSNGGIMTSSNTTIGGSTWMSASRPGNGTVTVTGQGSIWTNSFWVRVGEMNTGIMNITNGGVVSNAEGHIGHSAGSNGTVTVSGTGSTWNNSSSSTNRSLYVGDNGTGTLNVTNGGLVTSSKQSIIGSQAGGRGTVTVSGANSLLDTSSWAFEIGRYGRGTMNILNGGQVISAGANIGRFAGSSGTVNVAGTGSHWNSRPNPNSGPAFMVGVEGTGALNITNGGTISSAPGTIGRDSGSRGTVKVSGQGSSWDLYFWNGGTTLTVGQSGRGELVIADGGQVTSGTSWIGRLNGSQGSVLVTGQGSTWANDATLHISTDQSTGKGSLTVAENGFVSISQNLNIWQEGALNLHLSNSNMVQVGGNLSNEGVIRLTAGPGLAVGEYTPITVAGTWTGSGSYEAIGGTWNTATRKFTIAAPEVKEAGNEIALDLTNTQRLEITGTRQVQVGFNASAQAQDGGGSIIQFRAEQNTIETISSVNVLTAWDFTTNMENGFETYLTMEIGLGYNPNLLSAWHSKDGISWTLLSVPISYEGGFASISVNGFSSYAFTYGAIPEPSSALLVLLAGAAWVIRRKRSLK